MIVQILPARTETDSLLPTAIASAVIDRIPNLASAPRCLDFTPNGGNRDPAQPRSSRYRCLEPAGRDSKCPRGAQRSWRRSPAAGPVGVRLHPRACGPAQRTAILRPRAIALVLAIEAV
jgi:hypothetical protein